MSPIFHSRSVCNSVGLDHSSFKNNEAPSHLIVKKYLECVRNQFPSLEELDKRASILGTINLTDVHLRVHHLLSKEGNLLDIIYIVNNNKILNTEVLPSALEIHGNDVLIKNGADAKFSPLENFSYALDCSPLAVKTVSLSQSTSKVDEPPFHMKLQEYRKFVGNEFPSSKKLAKLLEILNKATFTEPYIKLHKLIGPSDEILDIICTLGDKIIDIEKLPDPLVIERDLVCGEMGCIPLEDFAYTECRFPLKSVNLRETFSKITDSSQDPLVQSYLETVKNQFPSEIAYLPRYILGDDVDFRIHQLWGEKGQLLDIIYIINDQVIDVRKLPQHLVFSGNYVLVEYENKTQIFPLDDFKYT